MINSIKFITFLSAIVVFILSFELNAQTNFTHTGNLKLKNSNNMFYETPFHLGINYGLLKDLTDYGSDETFHAMWGYYDFNLGGKIAYGQIEFGGISDKRFHGGAMFSSLGLNFKAVNFNRHIIYVSGGLTGFWGDGAAAIAAFVNPKYVFAICNVFGISANLRYIYRIGFPQRFLIASVGVQFFIK